jgi:hypothetical protein
LSICRNKRESILAPPHFKVNVNYSVGKNRFYCYHNNISFNDYILQILKDNNVQLLLPYHVMQFLENPIVTRVVEMFILTFEQMFAGTDINHVMQFSDEVKLFSDLCFQGKLYSHINETLGTDTVKALMMFVAFSDSKTDSDEKQKFKRVFPNIMAFTDAFKDLHGTEHVL